MNFDLNLNNYKKQELEDIFDLPVDYDSSTLDMKESKLRENIYSDFTLNQEVRNKTIAFLQEAKKLLLTDLKSTVFSKISAANIYNTDMSLKPVKVIQENGANMVINRPNTAFAQSFPSEFYEGIINPLKKRSLRQYLNIDTRFRDNYYGSLSTDFHFDLPIKFSSVATMQLTAFEIPKTYYYISSKTGNNFFTIGIESSSDSPREVVIIPDGNYSREKLLEFLDNYVHGASGPLSTLDKYKDLRFTINNSGTFENNFGTGQLIVGINIGVTLFDFSLEFNTNISGEEDLSTPLPLKLGWILGFRYGKYIGSPNYVGEAPIDLNGIKYMYLVVDDYNNNVNNSFYSAFNSSILNKNILARISLQTGTAFLDSNSQNNLMLTTTARQYFGPVDIQKLRIQLLDEYGRVIDLNNMDYSFCLTLQSLYDL
uniref:Uncharacterized protein n=1 Tax=viral metagenome TaxID=1070528 RepID=A0A6C0HAW9_9ZZZZ